MVPNETVAHDEPNRGLFSKIKNRILPQKAKSRRRSSSKQNRKTSYIETIKLREVSSMKSSKPLSHSIENILTNDGKHSKGIKKPIPIRRSTSLETAQRNISKATKEFEVIRKSPSLNQLKKHQALDFPSSFELAKSECNNLAKSVSALGNSTTSLTKNLGVLQLSDSNREGFQPVSDSQSSNYSNSKTSGNSANNIASSSSSSSTGSSIPCQKLMNPYADLSPEVLDALLQYCLQLTNSAPQDTILPVGQPNKVLAPSILPIQFPVMIPTNGTVNGNQAQAANLVESLQSLLNSNPYLSAPIFTQLVGINNGTNGSQWNYNGLTQNQSYNNGQANYQQVYQPVYQSPVSNQILNPSNGNYNNANGHWPNSGNVMNSNVPVDTSSEASLYCSQRQLNGQPMQINSNQYPHPFSLPPTASFHQNFQTYQQNYHQPPVTRTQALHISQSIPPQVSSHMPPPQMPLQMPQMASQVQHRNVQIQQSSGTMNFMTPPSYSPMTPTQQPTFKQPPKSLKLPARKPNKCNTSAATINKTRNSPPNSAFPDCQPSTSHAQSAPRNGRNFDEQENFKFVEINWQISRRCEWKKCNMRPFWNATELAMHVKNEHTDNQSDNKCLWNNCTRKCIKFKANYMLDLHMRKHTEYKPNKCWICNKTYSRLENLKTHERVHNNEKPFKCGYEFTDGPKAGQICKKAFTNASDKAKHRNRTHSDSKPFVCPVVYNNGPCSKSYTDPSSLRKHIITDHGELTYKHAKMNKEQLDAQQPRQKGGKKVRGQQESPKLINYGIVYSAPNTDRISFEMRQRLRLEPERRNQLGELPQIWEFNNYVYWVDDFQNSKESSPQSSPPHQPPPSNNQFSQNGSGNQYPINGQQGNFPSNNYSSNFMPGNNYQQNGSQFNNELFDNTNFQNNDSNRRFGTLLLNDDFGSLVSKQLGIDLYGDSISDEWNQNGLLMVRPLRIPTSIPGFIGNGNLMGGIFDVEESDGQLSYEIVHGLTGDLLNASEEEDNKQFNNASCQNDNDLVNSLIDELRKKLHLRNKQQFKK